MSGFQALPSSERSGPSEVRQRRFEIGAKAGLRVREIAVVIASRAAAGSPLPRRAAGRAALLLDLADLHVERDDVLRGGDEERDRAALDGGDGGHGEVEALAFGGGLDGVAQFGTAGWRLGNEGQA